MGEIWALHKSHVRDCAWGKISLPIPKISGCSALAKYGQTDVAEGEGLMLAKAKQLALFHCVNKASSLVATPLEFSPHGEVINFPTFNRREVEKKAHC